MAITGTLQADFSSFDAAVKSAEKKLDDFEGAAKKAEKALDGLSNSERFANSVTHLDALRRSQLDVTASSNTLRQSLSQFDGVLSSMGVNVGSAARGLGELGDASGKSIGQLGGLATAGLAAGAAMAGWKIGRVVSDFFGLDDVIGNATAKLLGWGDVAEQVALNNADQLARATKRVGYEVTSLTEALAINLVPIADWRSNAQLSAAATTNWHNEIAKVKAAGDLDSLTADLASQNFTLQDLSKRYDLSVEAIQVFVREQGNAATAVEAANSRIAASNATKLHGLQEELKVSREARAAAKQVSDAEEAANKRWAAGMAELAAAGQGLKGVLDTIDGSVVEAIKGYLDAGVSQETLARMYGLTAIQLRAIAAAYQAETAAKKASNDETKKGTADTQTNTVALQKQIEMVHTLGGEYLTLAAAQKLHESGGSAFIPTLTPQQAEQMGGREEIERQVARGRPSTPGTNTREGYADLAKRQASYEAMVRYLAGLTDVGATALKSLAPSPGAFAEGGVVQNITIYVNGTAADIARKVADEIMKTAKQGRRF